jgi:hypothetical protein
MDCTSEELWLDFQQWQEVFPYSKASRSAVELIRLPTKRGTRAPLWRGGGGRAIAAV